MPCSTHVLAASTPRFQRVRRMQHFAAESGKECRPMAFARKVSPARIARRIGRGSCDWSVFDSCELSPLIYIPPIEQRHQPIGRRTRTLTTREHRFADRLIQTVYGEGIPADNHARGSAEHISITNSRQSSAICSCQSDKASYKPALSRPAQDLETPERRSPNDV